MKVLYISFAKPDYSIDGVYIKGLRENNITVFDYFFPKSGLNRYIQIFKKFWQHRKEINLIMVGYASPQAAILLSSLTFKKIVYNALCSEYERKVVSRRLVKPASFKAFYYWLLDFLASHLVPVILLESQHQVDYFSNLFKINKKKCFVAYTGVDNDKFFYDPQIKKFDNFTVVFRGRLLPEAGAEYVVRAAKKLENQSINFILLGNGILLPHIQKLVDELNPINLKLMTDFLPGDELRKIMQQAHLILGQLADHPRLERTIPHKAYEALALKLPYLTAHNNGILELLSADQTCLVVKPADVDDLVNKIIWAQKHPIEIQKIAENGYQLYQKKLQPNLLAQKLLSVLK